MRPRSGAHCVPMSTDMGTDQRAAAPATSPATRTRAPGWRDWRLWVGVALVAASVVAGARLLDSADDTVGVWAAATDLAAGERVRAEDLELRRVRFGEEGNADRYLAADEALPGETRLGRGVAAGELVPRSALGGGATGVLEVPLTVPGGGVPDGVAGGDEVDVWVARPDDAERRATRVLDDVRVLRAPAPTDSFGATGERRLVLAVDDAQADQLGRALAAAAAGTVYVVREG